jgi:hypothetical protein
MITETLQVNIMSIQLPHHYFIDNGPLLQDHSVGITRFDIQSKITKANYILDVLLALDVKTGIEFQNKLLVYLKEIFLADIVTLYKKNLLKSDLSLDERKLLLYSSGPKFIHNLKVLVKTRKLKREIQLKKSSDLVQEILETKGWTKKYVSMTFHTFIRRILQLKTENISPEHLTVLQEGFLRLFLGKLVCELIFFPCLLQKSNVWNLTSVYRIEDTGVTNLQVTNRKTVVLQENEAFIRYILNLLRLLKPTFSSDWLEYYFQNIHQFAVDTWNEKVLSHDVYPIPNTKVCII